MDEMRRGARGGRKPRASDVRVRIPRPLSRHDAVRGTASCNVSGGARKPHENRALTVSP